jgi:DeoR family transcriptional regulator, aga operon transcriptional repressor
MSVSDNLSSVERQENILAFITQHGRVTPAQIRDQFSVSLATARRDIQALAQQGKLKRIYGGAISVRRAPPEAPVLQRSGEQAEEKQRIGQATADLIADGETIFIGNGSTALEVARHLRQRRHLTVITNSLLVMQSLAEAHAITVVGMGGVLDREEWSLGGHITEESLAEVRADKVIFSVRSVDLQHGLTNDNLQDTGTSRAVLRIGREVIIVADHTKCGRVSVSFVAPISAVHTFVTDTKTPAEFVEALAGQGVRVLTV